MTTLLIIITALAVFIMVAVSSAARKERDRNHQLWQIIMEQERTINSLNMAMVKSLKNSQSEAQND